MDKSAIDVAGALAWRSELAIFELRGEWRPLHRMPLPMRLSRDVAARAGVGRSYPHGPSGAEVSEAVAPLGLDAATQRAVLDRSAKLAERRTTLASLELRELVQFFYPTDPDWRRPNLGVASIEPQSCRA